MIMIINLFVHKYPWLMSRYRLSFVLCYHYWTVLPFSYNYWE